MRHSRLLSIFVLTTVVVLIWIANSDGRVNADTISMVADSRSGHIGDWHSALLELIWRPISGLISPDVLFLLQVIGLLYLTYQLLRVHLASLYAAAAAGLIWMTPLYFSVASSFTRDSWMLVGYLWVSVEVLRFRPGRSVRISHWVSLIAAVIFLSATRQNAVVLIVPHIFALLRSRTGLKQLSAGVIASSVITLPLLIFPLVYRVAGVIDQSPEAPVMLADLDEMSSRQRTMLLPESVLIGDVSLADLESLSTIYNPDPLWYGFTEKRVDYMLDKIRLGEVRSAWISAVRRWPLVYLAVRWKLFERQVGISGASRNFYLPSEIQNSERIRVRFDGISPFATSWIQIGLGAHSWVPKYLRRAWLWLIGFGMVWLAVARSRSSSSVDRASVHIVGVGSILYLASLFVGATDLQFRFVAPLIVIWSTGMIFVSRSVGSSCSAAGHRMRDAARSC